jgi:hypothetical protein
MLVTFLFVVFAFSVAVWLAERNADNIREIHAIERAEEVREDYEGCLAGRKFVRRMNAFYDDMAAIERSQPPPGSDALTREIIKVRAERVDVYLRSKWAPVPDCSKLPKPPKPPDAAG